MYGDLTDKRDLQTLDPREAWEQMEVGKLVLVDVRPKKRHDEAHPPGSVNAQLYRKVQPASLSALVLKRCKAERPRPLALAVQLQCTSIQSGLAACIWWTEVLVSSTDEAPGRHGSFACHSMCAPSYVF